MVCSAKRYVKPKPLFLLFPLKRYCNSITYLQAKKKPKNKNKKPQTKIQTKPK